MAAAASGSASVVRAILEKGAEVNELMTRTKYHAAHEASKGGHLDVLQVRRMHQPQKLIIIFG